MVPETGVATPPIKKRTWLWVLLGILACGVICVVAIAGIGIYYISRHVNAGHTSSADALRKIDEARAPFKDSGPLYELDRREQPKLTRRLEEMPTATRKAETIYVLVWDPRKERLARVSLPFWMLRLGKNKIDLNSGDFDFQRLHLDVEQLERIGPVLLFDYRPPTGQRVLVWTQ